MDNAEFRALDREFENAEARRYERWMDEGDGTAARNDEDYDEENCTNRRNKS